MKIEKILELIKDKSRNDYRVKSDSFMFMSDVRAYRSRRPEALEGFLSETLKKWELAEYDKEPDMTGEESLEEFCEGIIS